MNLHRENIRAIDEPGIVQPAHEKRAFVRAIYGGRRQRAARYDYRGHVAAENLNAVQINNRAIVSQQIEHDIRQLGCVRNRELVPEICGYKFIVRVRTIVDLGSFVSIAITELCFAASPTAVIETRRAPRGALI